MDYVEDLAIEWYEMYHKDLMLKELKNTIRANFLCDLQLTEQEFEKSSQDDVIDRIVKAAEEFYNRKEQMLGSEFMGNLERIAVLQTIDDKWREHLREMDDLKEGIHLRSYGQKDPLLEYKGEAYKLFVDLIQDINKETVNFAFKYFPQIVERRAAAGRGGRRGGDGLPQRTTTVMNVSNLQFSHSSELPAFITGGGQAGTQQQGEEQVAIKTYRKTEKQVGRNEPCPCGSGLKYKNCHGKKVAAI